MKILAATIGLMFLSAIARGQTDEIQVYDAGIADVGVWNLTWHNNFIARGERAPSFPGGITPDRSFNGVTEWAYGVTNWFEAGLYLPIYSISKDRNPAIDGGKIRLLFVVPHADDRKFFYGANFEFSYNSKHWDSRTYTSEIRPIVGWHFHPIDVIINPIVDNSYLHGIKGLDFAPASRVAYNLSPKWAVAVEEYDDFGTFREFMPSDGQSHELWGVFDHGTKLFDIEAGIGFGLTAGSDKITLKLLISRDLNSKGKN